MPFHENLCGGGHSDTCRRTHRNYLIFTLHTQMHLKWENPLSKPIKEIPQLTTPSGLLLNKTTIIYARKSLNMTQILYL
jgi:hypothetical protein